MPAGLPIVDAFMGIPFPESQAVKKYEFLRRQLRDEGSMAMSMPAEYMFKGVPKYDEISDPVELLVSELDRFGISMSLVNVSTSEAARRAVREHPDRFFAGWDVDPNHGPEAVRALEHGVRELGVKTAIAFPAGLTPQVPINDEKWYPVYAKCVELDVAICVCAGVPGPRVPFAPQYVSLIDEVCWFFPELRFVTRHGCEPWADLAVKLLLKWPNLYYSTSAFAPKHYPREIVDFANTRGADKVLYAGYYPAGLTLDRIFAELPDVPFRDHVWPKFLHENARRVFRLDVSERSERGPSGPARSAESGTP
jgi:predicted TIM-barrel fold metal-dependent hydrolase